jgi:hypothetical protein
MYCKLRLLNKNKPIVNLKLTQRQFSVSGIITVISYAIPIVTGGVMGVIMPIYLSQELAKEEGFTVMIPAVILCCILGMIFGFLCKDYYNNRYKHSIE